MTPPVPPNEPQQRERPRTFHTGAEPVSHRMGQYGWRAYCDRCKWKGLTRWAISIASEDAREHRCAA